MTAAEASHLPWTKLPFLFDPERLQADLARIPEDDWVPHFNSFDYAGEWSSLALRSRSGRANDIVPVAADGEFPGGFTDTPLMESCPHLREAVSAFRMPLKSVRLMRLHAGSRIKEHRDRDLGLADGELRIHVPVVTSEQVEFIVANRRLPLRAGESWFIDFSQPHRIVNGGSAPRVHLVIDGTLNDWAEDLLLRSAREIVTETFAPAGTLALERFRDLVYDEPALLAGLLPIGDPHEFLQTVVREAAARGVRFTEDDAESLLVRNRHEWMTRLTHL